MKSVKRISLIVVAVLVLACSAPLSSFAVDPVSAATMANALAQAITAYGASQGVSMTFDTANTDGIGEGVHELWDQYQEDMVNSSVTVSDYQNLAASAFPTLWIKIGEKIGVNLDAASVGEIDGFWNWLLSGPAEMTKVDNQYYEWTLNQNNTVDPILVMSNSYYSLNGFALASLPASYQCDNYYNNNYQYSSTWTFASNSNVGICFIRDTTDTNFYRSYLFCEANSSVPYSRTYLRSNGYTYSDNFNLSQHSGGIYYDNFSSITEDNSAYGNSTRNVDFGSIPVYSGDASDFTSVFGAITSSTMDSASDNISVVPYVGDAVPQNVYIPDNTDVNYEPLPAAIPTDITWDDTLFGDGTGTLTDAQSEAITQTVDQAIADNPAKTIELAESNPPTPSPSEVYIPFLPVTLPSFQFSLSGIWHYVTAWVASLGAWFSLVFTTWSYLPYAISVPVYATAVIVIVLGVYKRFFM